MNCHAWLSHCFYMSYSIGRFSLLFIKFLVQLNIWWYVSQFFQLWIDLILFSDKLTTQIIVKVILNLLQSLLFWFCLGHIRFFLGRNGDFLFREERVVLECICEWISDHLDLFSLLPVWKSHRVLQLFWNHMVFLPLLIGALALPLRFLSPRGFVLRRCVSWLAKVRIHRWIKVLRVMVHL